MGPELTPSGAWRDPSEADPRLLAAKLRQARRERSLLAALLLLAVLALGAERLGSRVWTVAVYDTRLNEFVEQVYLAQRGQAQQALEMVRARARDAHPYYGDPAHAAVFEAAVPGFLNTVVVRRSRRLAAVAPSPPRLNAPLTVPGADAPVLAAAEALGRVLQVVADARAVYDVTDPKKVRLVVALPTRELAQAALATRLETVANHVKEALKNPDHLTEQGFLQQVEVRPARRVPLQRVMTEAQATDYLTRGDPREAEHEVAAGESSRDIAAKYGIKVEALAEWNPGRDINRLKPGERLRVHRPEAPLTVLTVERHTVHDGGDVVTIEVRRHDGVETNRGEVDRRPAS